jgi:serpin B
MNKLFTLLLAAVAVCGCRSARETVEDAAARETVEEVAANTDVSYETSESEREIIHATNYFSFRLFQSVAANSQGKDILISPLGVVYSLDLISNGAGGHTKQLLKQQLGTSKFNQDDINALRRKMMLCHAKVVEDDLGYKSAFLKSSNLFLYHDNGQNINQDFINAIGHNYFADCMPFVEQNDAQQIVDKWNKDTNQGLIKDIMINEISDNLIINTLLFKASWTNEFENAKPDTFYVAKDKVSMVNMMRLTDEDRSLRYMQNEQYAMLRMPYDIRIPFVGCFYMDVLLPNENLTVDSLIQQLDMNQYEKSTRRLDKYDIIKVRFPKFQVKSSIDLNSMLSGIGLSELFSMNADFSPMSDAPLYLNKMMQDVEIEVDEKGTLAQAVTITSLASLSEDVRKKNTRAEFYANRPFIYFIRDYFGSICFAGVYRGGK